MQTNSNLTFRYFKIFPLFILFFFLFHAIALGQFKLSSDWNDELSKVSGQDQVDLFLEISTDLIIENLALSDSLAREGIAIAKQLGDEKSVHQLGVNIGRTFYHRDKIDEGFKWTINSLDFFKKEKSLRFDQAKAQLFLADLHIKRREFIKAESLIAESQSYFEETDNKLWLGKIAYSKGILNLDKVDYAPSLKYLKEAKKIGEEIENQDLIVMAISNIASIKRKFGSKSEALTLLLQISPKETRNLAKIQYLTNIGRVYGSLKKWEPSLEYFHKVLELEKKIGMDEGSWVTLRAIGVCKKNQMNLGDAVSYFTKSLAIKREQKLYPGSLLSSIGNCYNEIGQNETAEIFFVESLELATKNNDWEGIWGVHYNRAVYLNKIEKYEEALELLFKALEITKEKNNLRMLLRNHFMISNVFHEMGNEEKMKFHLNQFAIYQNSDLDDEIIESLEKLQIQKDSIHPDNLETPALSQNDLPKNNFSNTFIVVLLVGFLTALAFWFFTFSRKNEKASVESESLDQSKIDEYFKELFARMDQNKMNTTTISNQPSKQTTVNPINDMAVFLKDKLSTPNDWASFEHYFEKVNKDFLKNLKSNYPTISVNELNMCTLLKLNLRNKDIAQIMGISPDSVRKAQNRLSKKLELSSDEVLRDFVLKL